MKILNFDIETSGLRVFDEFKIGACHDGERIWVFKNYQEMIGNIGYCLDRGWLIAGHNIIAFDLPFLVHHDKTGQLNEMLRYLSHQILDTYVASRIYTANVMNNSMDACVKIMNNIGIGTEQKYEIKDWSKATEMDYQARVMGDVKIQKKLTMYFTSIYGQGFKGINCYQHISRIFPFLIESVANGIPLLSEHYNQVKSDLVEKKAQAACLSFIEFGKMNPNSTKQIHEACMKKYGEGLPIVEKISKTTGEPIANPAFNKDNEAEVLEKFPELKVVMDYRNHEKQLNFLSFTGSKGMYNRESNPNGNVVYPLFSFMNQRGYRSSYKQPPLNQIDRRIRKLIGKKGYKVIGCDIQSLELCELANVLSKVFDRPELSEEIALGVNPKQKTREIFGDELFANIPEEEKDEVAKRLNYAVLYGQSVTGTRRLLKLSDGYKAKVDRARKKRFPGLQEFMDFLEFGKDDDGCNENYYGLNIKAKGYKALNYFTQSNGAVASYMALGLFFKNLCKYFGEDEIIPLLMNHDEIQCLVSEDALEIEGRANMARERTEREIKTETMIDYDLKMNIKIGDTWGDSH